MEKLTITIIFISILYIFVNISIFKLMQLNYHIYSTIEEYYFSKKGLILIGYTLKIIYLFPAYILLKILEKTKKIFRR